MNAAEKYKIEFKKRLKELSAIQINIYLARAKGRLFVVTDANKKDIEDFGLSLEDFSSVSDDIEKIFKDILGDDIDEWINRWRYARDN